MAYLALEACSPRARAHLALEAYRTAPKAPLACGPPRHGAPSLTLLWSTPYRLGLDGMKAAPEQPLCKRTTKRDPLPF